MNHANAIAIVSSFQAGVPCVVAGAMLAVPLAVQNQDRKNSGGQPRQRQTLKRWLTVSCPDRFDRSMKLSPLTEGRAA